MPEAHRFGWRTGFRDDQGPVQIEALPHPAFRIRSTFSNSGFEYVNALDSRLGEPERETFLKAGKLDVFAEACRLPAVLILHFKKSSAPEFARL